MKLTFGKEGKHPQYGCPAVPVEAEAVCGLQAGVIAWVLEPDSSNPCITLTAPLGMKAVQNILNAFKNKDIKPSEN